MYMQATQLYKQKKLRVVGMGFKTVAVSTGWHRWREEGPHAEVRISACTSLSSGHDWSLHC